MSGLCVDGAAGASRGRRAPRLRSTARATGWTSGASDAARDGSRGARPARPRADPERARHAGGGAAGWRADAAQRIGWRHEESLRPTALLARTDRGLAPGTASRPGPRARSLDRNEPGRVRARRPALEDAIGRGARRDRCAGRSLEGVAGLAASQCASVRLRTARCSSPSTTSRRSARGRTCGSRPPRASARGAATRSRCHACLRADFDGTARLRGALAPGDGRPARARGRDRLPVGVPARPPGATCCRSSTPRGSTSIEPGAIGSSAGGAATRGPRCGTSRSSAPRPRRRARPCCRRSCAVDGWAALHRRWAAATRPCSRGSRSLPGIAVRGYYRAGRCAHHLARPRGRRRAAPVARARVVRPDARRVLAGRRAGGGLRPRGRGGAHPPPRRRVAGAARREARRAWRALCRFRMKRWRCPRSRPPGAGALAARAGGRAHLDLYRRLDLLE